MRLARLLQRHRQSQLKWHIESRRPRAVPVELHAGQVMHRKRTLLNECENAVQAPCAAGNLQRYARHQPHGMRRTDVSKKQILKVGVVWQVQENFSARLSPSHASVSLAQRFSLSPLCARHRSCSRTRRHSYDKVPFLQGLLQLISSTPWRGGAKFHTSGPPLPESDTAS